jgi:hypothetical protein
VLRELIVSQFLTELAINPGESRVGTPTNELVIGILGQLVDIDPAGEQDLISWEVKSNTMSGLYRLDSSNQIVPLLAADFPRYQKMGWNIPSACARALRFPDGSELTAQAVKRSIDRSAGWATFLVNTYLKDENVDGFADEDAVQVVDTYTVRFVLQEPTAHFPVCWPRPPISRWPNVLPRPMIRFCVVALVPTRWLTGFRASGCGCKPTPNGRVHPRPLLRIFGCAFMGMGMRCAARWRSFSRLTWPGRGCLTPRLWSCASLSRFCGLGRAGHFQELCHF